MTYSMRKTLRRSLEASPYSFIAAFNNLWPIPDDSARCSSGFQFLAKPNQWWIQVTLDASRQHKAQTVHYHLLEGHLLVDGQACGKLPSEHRSPILEELFGQQTLLTYPSGLVGMTYVLLLLIHGHQIHLGFRNGVLVVRAYVGGTVLEHIPRHVFGTPANFDLPDSANRRPRYRGA